jgi:outer membrane lipoprotein SlyB
VDTARPARLEAVVQLLQDRARHPHKGKARGLIAWCCGAACNDASGPGALHHLKEIFMNMPKLVSLVSGAVVLASLAACGTAPMDQPTYSSAPYTSGAPAAAYPQGTYNQGTYNSGQQAYVEYGRVTGVEVLQSQAQPQNSVGGAVIGGIVGGVLGNQVGGGSGKTLATAAGVVGGALAGNAIGKRNNTQVVESYRITVRIDNGAMRSYDVGNTFDLRPGDRVRIENGVLSRG